jgi:hypothetical protein
MRGFVITLIRKTVISSHLFLKPKSTAIDNSIINVIASASTIFLT